MKVTGNCIIWLSHPIIKMFEHNQTHIETHCTPYDHFINILKSQTCQISYLFSQLVSVNTIFFKFKIQHSSFGLRTLIPHVSFFLQSLSFSSVQFSSEFSVLNYNIFEVEKSSTPERSFYKNQKRGIHGENRES